MEGAIRFERKLKGAELGTSHVGGADIWRALLPPLVAGPGECRRCDCVAPEYLHLRTGYWYRIMCSLQRICGSSMSSIEDSNWDNACLGCACCCCVHL